MYDVRRQVQLVSLCIGALGSRALHHGEGRQVKLVSQCTVAVGSHAPHHKECRQVCFLIR